jgi:tetratricopeptide (TPR) repeat protein
MINEEVLWLVKSSGRVLGPFNTVRVTEMIRTREVSVLDEIASPLYRWQTIQYHPVFKDIILRLKKSGLQEGGEDPTWTGASDPTLTSNLTQTLTDNINADYADELTDDLSAYVNSSKEIVVHNVREEARPTVAPVNARYQPPQSGSNTVRQKADQTARGLWVVTVMVLLVVGVFVLQKRMNLGGELRPSVFNLKQSVIAQVNTGQYQEALRLLKSFYPDPNQAGEMAIYYGSFLIQLEGQTTVGRRLLNSVISAKRPEIKQAYTGLGIADILDGQLESAQENFDRATAIDASYTPAITNSATVELLRGNYTRAKALAIRALQLSPFQGEALLTLAQAELYLFKSKANMTELTQVNNLIHNYLQKQWDFASELGLYGLYFDFLRQDKTFDDRLRSYLDQDPRMTADHRHNAFIYRGHTQWRVLGRFCEQLVDGKGEGARIAALLASCMANESRWEQARKYIEKAVQQSPQDELVQAWFSHILKESGDGDQASVVLARANEMNRRGSYTLPTVLQGRFCQSKEDFACARDAWNKVLERNMDSLPAVAGMANYQVERGSHSEALKLLEKGLKISPEYIPLLMLKQRAEREGWYANN